MGPGQPTVLRFTPVHPVTHPGPVRRPNWQSRDRQTLPSARNGQCKQESLLAVVRLVRVSISTFFKLIFFHRTNYILG